MSDTSPLDTLAYRVLADVLGGNGRVVAYRPYFAHAFGGACNALLLSQLWFWTNTPTVRGRGDGWFWKSQKDITAETGLTRTETRTARRNLCEIGVLEEQVRGCPATVHFRICKSLLFERLWAHIIANPDEPTHTDYDEGNIEDGGNIGNDIVFLQTLPHSMMKKDIEIKRHQRVPIQSKILSKTIPGYIYLIASEQGEYKIGRTRNVRDRYKMIRIHLPFPVSIVHIIKSDDYIKAEIALHARYAAKRLNGEWFRLSEEDVAQFKAIASLNYSLNKSE